MGELKLSRTKNVQSPVSRIVFKFSTVFKDFNCCKFLFFSEKSGIKALIQSILLVV